MSFQQVPSMALDVFRDFTSAYMAKGDSSELHSVASPLAVAGAAMVLCSALLVSKKLSRKRVQPQEECVKRLNFDAEDPPIINATTHVCHCNNAQIESFQKRIRALETFIGIDEKECKKTSSSSSSSEEEESDDESGNVNKQTEEEESDEDDKKPDTQEEESDEDDKKLKPVTQEEEEESEEEVQVKPLPSSKAQLDVSDDESDDESDNEVEIVGDKQGESLNDDI